MKKILTLTFFLLIIGNVFSQKYLQLIPVEAPDIAGCNGKVKAIFHGGTAPYQIVWWNNSASWQPSAGTIADGLCENSSLYSTFADSFCTNFNSIIRLRSDTTIQVSLDTIIIVMPSAPGMCDGELHFQFNNVQGSDTKRFGIVNSTSSIVSGFSFTGLCEDTYYYRISRSSIEYEIQVNIDITPPSPCYHFTSDAIITPPTTTLLDSNLCDGQIKINTNGGSGSPFLYSFIAQVDGGVFENLNSIDQYVDSAIGICQGPLVIELLNDYNLFWERKAVYILADTTLNTTWNVPDSLLPNTDTIVVNALNNCIANYNIPFDTVYISSITLIGNNQYEFEVSFIQSNDTINTYVNAILDTSTNFFIDLSLFCQDSTRAVDPFVGKRNLIYHGVKLNTTKVNELENFASLKIYPNPFESIYTVELDLKMEDQITFELTDISGKIISTKNYSCSAGKNKLDFEFPNLSNGLYLMKMISENGQSVSKKIIKN